MTERKEFIGNPRSLELHRKALLFHTAVYEVIGNLPGKEKYNLADQLRRSATSVFGNLNEGYGRKNYMEEYHFLNISVGSLCEVRAYFDICLSQKYITEEEYKRLDSQGEEVMRLLIGKMRSIERIVG